MHKSFPEWYVECNPEPSEELLERRWSGVESLCKDPTSQHILDLVLVAFGQQPPSNGFQETLDDTFTEHDKAYTARRTSTETAILAGASLAHSMSDMDSWEGIHAALSIACYSLGGKRLSHHCPWLPSFAQSALSSKSEQLRSSRSELSPPTKYKLFSKKEIEEFKTADNWKDSIDKLFDNTNAVLSSLGKIAEHLHAAQRQTAHQQRLYEEELDILWWIFGGASRSLHDQFSAIDPKVLSIIAGHELASFVQVLPGPYAAQAFITAVLTREHAVKQCQVKTAINKLTSAQKGLIASEPTPPQLLAFCPIHTAIFKSMESTEWSEPFERATGLSASLQVHLATMAEQTYLEGLLIKSQSEP